MNEHAQEQQIAARFRTFDRPRSEKPSGAQRRKDTRPRTLMDGVWRLPFAPTDRVLRGRPRS